MQALVPLFDSLSPAFAGPCFIRISAILAGLVKLHNIIDCKAMPSQCRSMLKNFVWEMGSGVSKQNATTIVNNGTATVRQKHVVLSTLNLSESCDTIIAVLCTQVSCIPF